jgi:3-hydroxyacyl-[acyl-carrier-protein] dehydratase
MPLEWTLRFEPEHPAFVGHFPGMPIVPGVLLLDEVLRGITERTGSAGAAPEVCAIASAKFLRPVGPGETVAISCELDGPGPGRFVVSCGAHRVASGQLAFAAKREPMA